MSIQFYSNYVIRFVHIRKLLYTNCLYTGNLAITYSSYLGKKSMLITRIESGSHRLTYLTLWPTRQSGCDPHMTHILKFLFKVMQNDMKQCHRFLCSWQDTELVSCTDFLKMKFLNTTDFKTAWGIKLVSDQCGSVHSPDPRFTHVSDANVFSKEHITY